MKTFDRYVLAVAAASAPLVDQDGVAELPAQGLVDAAQRLAAAVCDRVGHEGPDGALDEYGRATRDFDCMRCGWLVPRYRETQRPPHAPPADLPDGANGSPYR